MKKGTRIALIILLSLLAVAAILSIAYLAYWLRTVLSFMLVDHPI